MLIGEAFTKREKGNGVLRCSIYPEGGFLVEGQVQGIVASVTDYSGKAISGVKLSVVNDKGDTLCVGKTRTSGLANLKFVPLAARHYKLFVTDNGVTTSLEIPQAYPDRMKLQCAINGNKLMFEVLNANGSLPASRLYLYDKANGLVLIGKGRPSGIVPLGNRLGVTTVFLTDSVGNVLSESSLTSKDRMTELPSLPDTIAADSIGAWRGQVEGSLERHFLYSVWVIGGKGESQDNSRSGQIPTAYGCGVANRHNLIRARHRGQRMRENKKTL